MLKSVNEVPDVRHVAVEMRGCDDRPVGQPQGQDDADDCENQTPQGRPANTGRHPESLTGSAGEPDHPRRQVQHHGDCHNRRCVGFGVIERERLKDYALDKDDGEHIDVKKNEIADCPGRWIDARKHDDHQRLDRRARNGRVEAPRAESRQTRAGDKEFADCYSDDRRCKDPENCERGHPRSAGPRDAPAGDAKSIRNILPKRHAEIFSQRASDITRRNPCVKRHVTELARRRS